MMSRLIFVLITLLPTTTLAASGASGDHSIPWAMIGQQAFNLILVLGLLIFFLRKKVAHHFAQRKVQYKQLIEKAEEAKVKAEKNKLEITERLQKLQSNVDESLVKAKSEAEELKAKIVEEAKSLSARFEEDARRTAEFELERAKLQLRNHLLKEAFQVAQENLPSKVGGNEQQRLKSEFVEKIQVVQ